MILRPETPSDVAAIRRVHEAAFPSPAEANIVDALRDSGCLSISWVAVDDDGVVGHIAFSPVTLNDQHFGLGLAPVAVLPAHQRSGIGGALITRTLDECREHACDWVVVLGDPAYYGKFGFTAASNWNLQDEYGGGNAFQARWLSDSPEPCAGGLVKYSAAFAAASE
ncbi:MAG: N-acetyltransferase [Pseudomonadota bacterium]